MRVDIYTDGSHLDKQHPENSRLGCGGVIVDHDTGKILNEFSIQLLPQYLKMTFDISKCSNPSAELIGVLQALYHFKKELKKASEVVFYEDYLGCKSWMEGTWKIKEPYIQRIKDDIIDEITEQGLTGKVKFSWVKGHQNSNNIQAKMNNRADQLAKGEKDE